MSKQSQHISIMRTSQASTIGTVAEMLVSREAVKNGWKVAYPYGSDTPFDILLYNDGKVISVQVKATGYEREKGQGVTRMVSLEKYQDIDIMILVDALNDDLYIFKTSTLPSSRVRFTLSQDNYPDNFNAWGLV